MIDSKDQNISKLFICNHEEADTRMIYHASLQGANSVVISANDSDVFFLGTYACALDKNRNWYFDYQSCSFADLRRIADLLGDSALHLPAFHSLTGCDTTSYFYFRGKTAPWERAIKTPNSLDLIKNLGCESKLSDEDIDNSVEFIRRFIYNGKKGEDLVDTRIRMYKEQVKKKSSALPPDPNSIRYDILRKHHQAFVWKRCLNDIIEPLPLSENGWKVCNDIVLPIWYECSQLPPHIGKRDKPRPTAVPENDVVSSSEFPKALEDTEVIQVGPPAKRCRLRKVQRDTCSSNSRLGKDYFDVSEYESDSSEWERLSDFSSSDSSDDSDWT